MAGYEFYKSFSHIFPEKIIKFLELSSYPRNSSSINQKLSF